MAGEVCTRIARRASSRPRCFPPTLASRLQPVTAADSHQEGTSRSSRARVVSNSIFSVTAYVVYLPVGLIVSRYTVEHIGLHAFGVWATLTALTGYGGLLDLATRVPLIKYVAEYAALGRERDVNTL